MDWSKFDKTFYSLVEHRIPEASRSGLFEALNEMLKDARDISPRAPKDKGDLWGSAEAEVLVKLGRLIGIAAFNISYATKWHELPREAAAHIAFKLPGAGPKFLETKMIVYKDKYMWIIANKIKRA